jgi:hypothetical protein
MRIEFCRQRLALIVKNIGDDDFGTRSNSGADERFA